MYMNINVCLFVYRYVFVFQCVSMSVCRYDNVLVHEIIYSLHKSQLKILTSSSGILECGQCDVEKI